MTSRSRTGGAEIASGLVDVLFVPLVVTLAIGVGSLPRLLSTRVMVYGGYISFSLYMVHELVHTAWNWFTAQYEIVLAPSWVAMVLPIDRPIVWPSEAPTWN